jgi:hypothetical protein
MMSILNPVGLKRAPSIDRRGARFEHDGRILRAFRSDLAPFYRDLLQSPSAESLFAAGLVRSRIVDTKIDGFDLVVACERVPIVTFPPEWPTAMLREAGLLVARLGRALAELGLGLEDAHPWNVLFDDTRAVWIDLGSIVRADHVSVPWILEFRRHVAVPLALHAIGRHRLADMVAAEHRTIKAKAFWERRPLRDVFPPGYVRLSRRRLTPRDFFDGLVRYLEGLATDGGRTEWSEYVQAPGAVVGETVGYDPKQRAVDEFLAQVAAGRLLDVGANAGWFSELAVSHGHKVIAVDTDDRTLGSLFRRAKTDSLPILPLRMDVMWPTGSHGMGLAYADAPTRLRSDVTMWLAVIHHLVGRQGITFEMFAATVDQFTTSAALVEFVPRNDRYVSQWPISNEPWYDADHLITAMAPFFNRVEVLPSFPDPRVVMLFQRS